MLLALAHCDSESIPISGARFADHTGTIPPVLGRIRSARGFWLFDVAFDWSAPSGTPAFFLVDTRQLELSISGSVCASLLRRYLSGRLDIGSLCNQATLKSPISGSSLQRTLTSKHEIHRVIARFMHLTTPHRSPNSPFGSDNYVFVSIIKSIDPNFDNVVC